MEEALKVKNNELDKDFLWHYIFFLFCALNYLFNFLGSPAVKWIYTTMVVIAFMITLTKSWKSALVVIIPLSIFEGQGRILWGYNPFFRLTFDMLLGLGLVKSMVVNKKIYNGAHLPPMLKMFISLHFAWYLMELFNPTGVGPLDSLITLKIYIFPFLLFFAFTLDQFSLEDKEFKLLTKAMLWIISFQAILVIYQMGLKEEFIYQISQNYQTLIPGLRGKFVGSEYRSWGTGFLPGVPSVYLFYTLPFLFVFRDKGNLRSFGIAVLIALSWFCLFMLQVRSAWIKHILVTIFSTFLYIYSGKLKFKNFARILVLIAVVTGVVLTQFGNLGKDVTMGLDLETSFNRVKALTEEGGLESARRGPSFIVDQVLEKTTLFGFGLGMTGNYSEAYKAKKRELIQYRPIDYWHFDNFYFFSLLELGLGAIFYVGAVFITVGYLLSLMINSFNSGKGESFRIVGLSFFICLTVLIGNWAGIGIPFNPESFYFWFWASLGLNYYHRDVKNELEKA